MAPENSDIKTTSRRYNLPNPTTSKHEKKNHNNKKSGQKSLKNPLTMKALASREIAG